MNPVQLVAVFVMPLFGMGLGQISLSSLPCQTRQGKIVGGVDAARSETPYIVSLTRRGGHFCGGSIINEKWIMTAGHCLCNGLNKIMKPAHIKAVLGLHKISDFKSSGKAKSDSPRPFEVSIGSIVVHPDYSCDGIANDIALLEVQENISFRPEVSPICVPNTENSIKTSKSGTVSGWGWTNEDQSVGVRADTLQQASVEFWDNKDCAASFKSQNKTLDIAKSQLCAGKKVGGIDSCWADSGGPLVNDQNVLVGVVSTGIGCARPGLPGIYTRVFEYLDWIESTIKG